MMKANKVKFFTNLMNYFLLNLKTITTFKGLTVFKKVYECMGTLMRSVGVFIKLTILTFSLSFFHSEKVQAQCSNFLNFSGTVTRTGTAGAVGTVYKFTNVVPGVDAHVKILAKSNANLDLIDVNTSGYDEAWQPQLDITGADGYIDWEISFKTTLGVATTLSCLSVTALGVDGTSSTRKEWVQTLGHASTNTAAGTTLSVVNNPTPSPTPNPAGSIRATGSSLTVSLDTLNSTASFQVNYNSLSVFNWRTGGTSNGMNNVVYSMYFEPLLTLNAGRVATSQGSCLGAFNPSIFTSEANASGASGTIQYQWASSITTNVYSASSGWVNIIGATGATYDPPLVAVTTYYIRLAKVQNGVTWRPSNVVTAGIYNVNSPACSCNNVYSVSGSNASNYADNQMRILNTTDGTYGSQFGSNMTVGSFAMGLDTVYNRFYYVSNTGVSSGYTPGPILYYMDAMGNNYSSGDTLPGFETLESYNKAGFSPVTKKTYFISNFGTKWVSYLPTASGLSGTVNTLSPVNYYPASAIPLSSTNGGGDLVFDFDGNGYIITNPGHFYRIIFNADNSVDVIYLGKINLPTTQLTSLAFTSDGKLYLSGRGATNPSAPPAYLGADVYNINLNNLSTTKVNTALSASTVDYASCIFPQYNSNLEPVKSYIKTGGSAGSIVEQGDTIEYTIVVRHTGTISEGNVKVSDNLPASVSYIPNSTTMNGVTLTDVSSGFRYGVVGGDFVNSTTQALYSGAISASDSAVIKFKVRVSIGCGNVNNTATITSGVINFVQQTNTISVSAYPYANAGVDRSICIGANTTLGSSAIAGYTYLWTPSTGLNATTIVEPIANPTTTTQYIVAVTQTAGGCVTRDTVLVTVDAIPTANAGADQANCTSSNFTLNASAPSLGSGLWSVVSGTATIATPTNRASLVTLLTSAATLRWTVTNGACQATDDVQLSVGGGTVSAGTIAISQTGCGSFNPSTFTNTVAATAPSGTISYQWAYSTTASSYTGYESQWTLISGATSATYDPAMVTQTTYFVRLAQSSICTNWTPSNVVWAVTLNSDITLVASPSGSVCEGTDVTFNVTGSAPLYNMVINGDFHEGLTGFGSDFTYDANTNSTSAYCGSYKVGTLPSPVGDWSTSCPDEGHGRVLMVNGTGGAKFWKYNVTVTPNTNYHFEFQVAKLSAQNSSNLRFDIGTETIEQFPLSSYNTCEWTTLSKVWNSGSNSGTIEISLLNLNNNCNNDGNDFMIDNMVFRTAEVVDISILSGIWSWTGPAGFTSTIKTPTITNITPAQAGTYTVNFTIGGCTGTASANISLLPSPTVVASNSVSGNVCVGGSFQLTATPNPTGGSFSWTGPNGFTSTTQNPTFSPATTAMSGIYSVVYRGVNGCNSPVASTTVTVHQYPSVTAPSNQTVCNGTSTATVTFSGSSVAGTTYNWTNNNTAIGLAASGTGNITAFTATNTGGSSISATITVTPTANGCTGTPQVFTITVDPSPTASISGTATICSGNSTTLTASGGGTYLWSTGETSAAISVNPTSNTTYTVTVTNAATCTAIASQLITVNAAPTASVSGTATICSGSSTTLTASGGGTYAWSSGETTAAITKSPTSNTTYTVTVTSGGCTAVASRLVTVNSAPTASISGTATICSGSSTTLTASGGGTYSWSTGESTAAITKSPTSNTTYTVTVTSGGCTAVASRLVTVNAAPTASVSGTATICSGSSTTLTASGGGTYAWSSGETTAAITKSPTSNTTYTVTVTSGGCTAVASRLVTVDNLTTVTITANSNTVCVGGTVSFTSNQNVSGQTYQWQYRTESGSWANVASGGTTSAYTTPALSETTYYRLNVIQGACNEISAAVRVDVVADPIVTTPIPSATICVGGGITLSVSSTGGTGTCTFQWQSRPDSTSPWVNVAGETNATFTTPALSTSIRYKAIRSCTGSGCCN